MLLERFLKYVKVDTQSDPESTTSPSTEKQKNLAVILVDELKELGLSDVRTDDYGYVYATLPTNCNSSYRLGFIAHMDTSSAVSGANVCPVITYHYDGSDIVLKEGVRLYAEEFSELKNHIGKTIISSDGTTLLGADDKAGIAEIMEGLHTLIESGVDRPTIKVAFTPDEEVGRGTDHFDIKGFDCDGAYTLDGGELGELEYENFNAAGVKVTVNGKSVHPGSAKGKMINAGLVLMELQGLLPAFDNPMYTEGYEGFFHLDSMNSTVDRATANYIIRDHDRQKFEAKKLLFGQCVDFLNKKYGEGTVMCDITDSYYNMKEIIEQHKHLVDNALVAMEQAGVKPLVRPIRGGTDGARLSFDGLPCPNLFTGGYNFHGRYEYIPLEDMHKAVEVMVNLAKIYAKK